MTAGSLAGLFLVFGAAVGEETHFSGLLPSNADSDCFLHYSFTRSSSPTAAPVPVLLWLQGGPGLSSQLGNLFEIGDHSLNIESGELEDRKSEHRWSRFAHLLFLDAPEGSGFSYCESEADLPRSSEEVAIRMRFALEEFFKKHFGTSDEKISLVLAGEDYAGHILPPMAGHLVKHALLEGRVELGGLMIGNGHTHPVSQVLTRPESGKYFGLIEGGCYNDAYGFASAASFLAGVGRYDASFEMRSKLETTVKTCAGGVNLKDIRTTEDFEEKMKSALDKFMNSDRGKSMFGVAREMENSQIFRSHNAQVIETMRTDVMRSVAHYVGEVLDAKIPVLLYQGLFDWIDGVFSNEQWILDLQWHGKLKYNQAERQNWTVNGDLVGFKRSHGPLTQVTVRNAGHSVPLTQPDVAFALAKDFVESCSRHAKSL